MRGHAHDPTAGTQNQGNTLGARACVRQSKLYRTHESGNAVKSILGQSNLCWRTDVKEGAYHGHDVFDHEKDYGSYNHPSAKQGYGNDQHDDRFSRLRPSNNNNNSNNFTSKQQQMRAREETFDPYASSNPYSKSGSRNQPTSRYMSQEEDEDARYETTASTSYTGRVSAGMGMGNQYSSSNNAYANDVKDRAKQYLRQYEERKENYSGGGHSGYASAPYSTSAPFATGETNRNGDILQTHCPV